MIFLLLAACNAPDTGKSDTGRPDAGDTGDTDDTGDTQDTGDTHDSGDTHDTGDTGDTQDTGDTHETGDTGETDADADGWPAGPDCDDFNPAINPGAREVCDDDNDDEDCDSLADDDDPSVDANTRRYWTEDLDGDGWGAGSPVDACDGPAGWVDQFGDCDDADPEINPDAIEICDATSTDEDCDGLVNDADPDMLATGLSTFYVDADGDGFGDDTKTGLACEVSPGYAAVGGDCNDAGSAVYPGADESCNPYGIDFDCDGLLNDDEPDVDPASMGTFYVDGDGDTYGDPATLTHLCDRPSGYVLNDDDCDDADAAVSPDGTEVCDDGIDQDCDGAPSPDCGFGGDLEIGYTDPPVWTISIVSDFQLAFGGDLDGDGAEDMYLSSTTGSALAPNGGAVVRHAGLPSADVDWEDGLARIDGEAMGEYFGQTIAAGADLDGDGIDDLVAGMPNNTTSAYGGGVVRVFPSATGSVSSDSTWELEGDYTYEGYGAGLAVGDADGDGADDLVMSGNGTTLLVRGPLGTGTYTDSVATASYVDVYAGPVRIGDFDGDGVASVLIGAYLSSYGASSGGALYQVDGDRTGTIDLEGGDADGVFYGYTASAHLGVHFDVADVDGDGYDDYLVGRDDDEVDVFFGPGRSGSSYGAGVKLNVSGPSTFGSTIVAPGDLDGDGNADVAIGDGGDGIVYVFAGPIRDYTASYDTATCEIRDWTDSSLGWSQLYGPGDVDADGYDDLMVGGGRGFSLLLGGGI